MAIVDLTTVARVKAVLEQGGKTWSAADALIAQLVTEVSAAIERHLCRGLKAEARVEDFDIAPGQRVLVVEASPIAASPAVVVRADVARVFGDDTIVATTDYVVRSRLGIIEFDAYQPAPGPGVVRVAYTGGLGADGTAIAAGYPDLAAACEMQVAAIVTRRGNLGSSATSGGGGATTYTGALDWLPQVKALLAPLRRTFHA